MKAINYACVTRSGLFLLLHAVLSLVFTGSVFAQTNVPVPGKEVKISKQYPTRSHIALLVTRNGNNWVHTHAYRNRSGKLVSLSAKDDKSLHVGDVVIVPWKLVMTHPDTLKAESISLHCQRTYTDSRCAWRIAKISSIPLRDTLTTYVQREVYVPNSFVAKATALAATQQLPRSRPAGAVQNKTPVEKPGADSADHQSKGYFARFSLLIALLLVIPVALIYFKRKNRLLSLVDELTKDLRSVLPLGMEMTWVVKAWSWSVKCTPPNAMTIQQFTEYKGALGTWVISGPLRHLGMSERYAPIPGTLLQQITVRAPKLAKWSPETLSLAERQRIEARMRDFSEEFVKHFGRQASNAAIGDTESIEFNSRYQPEQRILEIRMRPAKPIGSARKRQYPNYTKHKPIIEADVSAVLRHLPDEDFSYIGCSPDHSWVVLRFNLETSTEGSYDEPTELVSTH